jgi:hypothetical protein
MNKQRTMSRDRRVDRPLAIALCVGHTRTRRDVANLRGECRDAKFAAKHEFAVLNEGFET